MSYDINIKDPDTGETIELDAKHNITGGTYCIGGTTEAWLNITYNYAPFFYEVFGEKGIRTIYGMKVLDSLPMMIEACSKLQGQQDEDYWAPTEDNARAALLNLIYLGIQAPNGIWEGD